MSWVASLLYPAQAQQLAPSSPERPAIFLGAQDYKDDSTGRLRRGWSQEQAEPMDEEEEAARSPYWHVSWGPEGPNLLYYWGAIVDTIAVHDSRRGWWYIRGYVDALYRYSQDPPTGGPAHATEIRIIILHIHQDFPAGRNSKGALQRCHSSFSWLVSWYHHILRNVRI